MVKFIIFNLLLLACCGYALLRGGAPERIGAAIYAVGTGLTVLAYREAATRFGSVEVGILVVDMAALIAFLVLALRARRFWPLWMIAFHIISTAGHVLKLADPEMMRWAYAFMLGIWSYPMLLLLAIGTFNHRRRLARFGVDPSWTSRPSRSDSAFPPPSA